MSVQEIEATIRSIKNGSWPNRVLTEAEERRYLEHFEALLKVAANQTERKP